MILAFALAIVVAPVVLGSLELASRLDGPARSPSHAHVH